MGQDQFEKERAGYLQQIAILNRHIADLQHLLAMANAHITKFFYLMGFRTDPPAPPIATTGSEPEGEDLDKEKKH